MAISGIRLLGLPMHVNKKQKKTEKNTEKKLDITASVVNLWLNNIAVFSGVSVCLLVV